MNIVLRAASVTDADDISQLCMQLGYNVNTLEAIDRLNTILNYMNATAFVACAGDILVGWVHVFYTMRIESAAFCEIGGLVVCEEYRANGVGKLLVNECKQWAKDMGSNSLRVRSNIVREAAKVFYTKMGFSVAKTQNVFEMDI